LKKLKRVKRTCEQLEIEHPDDDTLSFRDLFLIQLKFTKLKSLQPKGRVVRFISPLIKPGEAKEEYCVTDAQLKTIDQHK